MAFAGVFSVRPRHAAQGFWSYRHLLQRAGDVLSASDPAILAGWERQRQRIEEAAAYAKRSPDFVRQGRGDTATHKLFVERSFALLAEQGRLVLVIPAGIYTDLGTKELRQMLFEAGRIEYLYSFSNERFFFPAVDHRVKFTLLGAQRGESSDGFWATFRFNPRVAVRPAELAEFLADPRNLVYIKLETVTRLNPDALSVFEFKDQLDYSVTEKIYGGHPLLGDALPESWNVKFTREFDKTNDRDIFNSAGIGIPVLQGANLGFYGEVLEAPTIWVDEDLGRILDPNVKTTN